VRRPGCKLFPRVATVAVATAFALASAGAQPRHGRLFPPRDLGLLEGPDRDAWQQPSRIMDALGIGDGSVVADIGAGGGWFTIRLARRVGPNGIVYAEDVQPQMMEAIERRVQREGLRNVRLVLGTVDDPRLPEGRLDAVLIVDAYHEMENRVTVLRNVARALKPNGRLGIVDFRVDGGGPGPALEDRIAPERVVTEAQNAGLRTISHETFLPFQYLLVFGRPSPASPPSARP
jgi:ubiquinone/menaquinone biosynthesis C-methylase UbiE